MTWAVHTGDCRTVLEQIHRASIDAVVADPPYGMAWDTDSTRFTHGNLTERGEGVDSWGDVKQDAEPFDPAPWLDFPRVVLFGSNHYASRLPLGSTLVWIKKNEPQFGTFLSDAELAWMKGGHGVYCFQKPFPPPSRMFEGGGKTLHPCQKPIDLMRWCMDIAKVPVGATVLDPYCGSGTVGVACLLTGRNYIGIEVDPKYAAIARHRIAAADPIGKQVDLMDVLAEDTA